jgi:aldose 1-epimerase
MSAPVTLISLLKAGYEAAVTDYGATLVKMLMPDKDGNVDDCVLGFDSTPEYISDSPYFGESLFSS